MGKKLTKAKLEAMNLDELQILVGEKGLTKEEMISKLLPKK